MKFGVDVSTLLETELLGGKFFDDGKEGGALEILKKYGASSVRLRLWVDPYGSNGEGYGAGDCGIETILTLAKRTKKLGLELLLDLHYSDFWCDPSRQLLPKKWQNKTLAELEEIIYTYTRDVLNRFKSEGVYPDLIQTGNEITGGMMWPIGKIEGEKGSREREQRFKDLAVLLKSAGKAVRESGNAKIMLHLERSGDNECYREWFDSAIKNGVEFDIIGVSYYPFWHGNFNKLKANLDDLVRRYNKEIMVVETSYPFTAKHFSDRGTQLVMHDNLVMPDGGDKPFPFSVQGQSDFLQKLFKTAKDVEGGKCTTVYYWEPAWIPCDGATWASEAAREYINEQHKQGGNEWANQCMFDYKGNALQALKEVKKFL